MKLYKLSIIAVALSIGLVSCNDFLEQDPPSQLTPESFYTSEDQIQAAANQFYTDILPGHGGWNYGTYTTDNNTDNQMSRTPGNQFSPTLYRTSNTNGSWNWSTVRNVNYQLNVIKNKYEAKKISGNDANLRQYIGELYFFRAYAYFELLKRFGDLPILTEALPDKEDVLVEASPRKPRNEVARFIINNLDTAANYMKDHNVATTRINYDAVELFKSRVALFEGSWLTNFAGTAFVPNGTGWPGAEKNAGYQFPTGNIEAEAKWFFEQAATAAQLVADKYKTTLAINNGVVPQAQGQDNPYLDIWGSVNCSGSKEVLLWRQYSKSLGVQNDVEVSVQKGNIGTGFTRSMIESYLMKDGKPIYASTYTYCDTSLNKVAQDRDPRLAVLLKKPGDINCFINVNDESGTHWTHIEPIPNILTNNNEDGYITGYSIRKGITHDRALTANGGSYNACIIFRASEALLNYMEAKYMLTHSLTSGNILEYWRIIRTAAGFTGSAIDPVVTINATDMNKESKDWGAYTAGTLLSDKVLYNIRRERRCEFIAEGLRDMDLKRWRSYDQLIIKPAHTEGFHFWGTVMQNWYKPSDVIADGSSSATVSSRNKSEYFRPHEIIEANNNFYDGLTWKMAHYLEPLPLRQFLLTAPDHSTMSKSPMYQNPYWPMEANKSALK